MIPEHKPCGTNPSSHHDLRRVCEALPLEHRVLFVETHGDTLGCLLRRNRSKREVINDLHGQVLNWWLVVREQRAAFDRRVAAVDRYICLDRKHRMNVEEGDRLQQAVAFHVNAYAAMTHRTDSAVVASGIPREGVDLIADRLRTVQLLHRSPLKLLQRLKRESHAVVFVDANSTDGASPRDMLEALRGQEGRCLVLDSSSICERLGDEGWHRHEGGDRGYHGDRSCDPSGAPIWMNYQPAQAQLW